MKRLFARFNHHKATFLLSVLGFLGSLIFYYTVLREVQGGTVEDQILIELHHVNARLDSLSQEGTDINP